VCAKGQLAGFTGLIAAYGTRLLSVTIPGTLPLAVPQRLLVCGIAWGYDKCSITSQRCRHAISYLQVSHTSMN